MQNEGLRYQMKLSIANIQINMLMNANKSEPHLTEQNLVWEGVTTRSSGYY